MKIRNILMILVLGFLVAALSPIDQGVRFENLKDGQKVKSPFLVKMRVFGKTVAEAGDPKPNTGHHHIIVDGGPIDAGKIIIADAKHIHFGKGQTETELKLEKGKHTLTLQFADLNHISFGKEWSSTISVDVE